MARLDRLAPAKELAQIGACIGREFDHDLLATMSPLRADVGRAGIEGQRACWWAMAGDVHVAAVLRAERQNRFPMPTGRAPSPNVFDKYREVDEGTAIAAKV